MRERLPNSSCGEWGTQGEQSVCLELAACPCEWGGSFFPPGTVLQKDCGNNW